MQPGRNDPCPCGSGKKFKKCCGAGNPSAAAGRAQPLSLDAAIAAFESGRYAAAAEAAQAFTRMQPNEPAAWQVLGISAYYLGDVATAADAFERLVKLERNNPEAWNNLALFRCEQGELDTAYAAAQQALKLQPAMAEAHNNLGNIHRARHEYAQAEAAYRQVIELGLKTPQVFCNLGSVLQEQGANAGAREAYRQAIALDANFAAAHSNLGGLLLIEGEMLQAREHLEKAYALTPDDVELLGNLGDYWQEAGGIEKASDFYHRALTLQPENANVIFRVGQFYLYIGDNKQAKQYLLKAIQIDPQHAKSLAALGEIAFTQANKIEAEEYFQLAMKYGGDDLFIVRNYCDYLLKRMRLAEAKKILETMTENHPGNVLLQIGLAEYYEYVMQHDQAATLYSRLVEEHPDNAGYLVRWSSMEEKRHQVEAAVSLAQRAIELEPDLIPARQALVRALARGKKYQSALSELLAIDSAKIDHDPEVKFSILFERGRLEDRLKEYDAAYADFVEANAVRSQAMGTVYHSGADRKLSHRLRNCFSTEHVAHLPRYDSSKRSDDFQPIFIVGFPRSGTTLLEQILASHSAVSAGDELVFIEEVRNQVKIITSSDENYPEVLLDDTRPVTQEVLGKLRDYYLDRVREQGVAEHGNKLFTDKMPHNLVNLGLISLIFPDAPIIHITRHPMDACLSAFMANFGHGHGYTSTMENTANHYATLMELAEHYKSVLDMRYLQIRYEDILDDAEGKVREVLEFVGLPWEDACLKFHETKRISKTASYAQVTQKLYTTSRYRYKNYYKHLEPLEPILRETMQRFGYTFEPPEAEG